MIRLRLVVRDGWDLWRKSKLAFLVSLRLIPPMLVLALFGRFREHVESVEGRLFKTFSRDLTPKQHVLFRRNPGGLSLTLAHQYTCMLWFVPMTRYQLMYSLAGRLERFWTWNEGPLISQEPSPP